MNFLCVFLYFLCFLAWLNKKRRNAGFLLLFFGLDQSIVPVLLSVLLFILLVLLVLLFLVLLFLVLLFLVLLFLVLLFLVLLVLLFLVLLILSSNDISLVLQIGTRMP